MFSSIKCCSICQCLCQHHSIFYHVDCDKHHDQYSFTTVITFIITIRRETENLYRKSKAVISQEYMSSPGSPIINYI